jgi:hypothetical protein
LKSNGFDIMVRFPARPSSSTQKKVLRLKSNGIKSLIVGFAKQLRRVLTCVRTHAPDVLPGYDRRPIGWQMVLQDHSASRPPKSKTWVGEMVRKKSNMRGAAGDSISELIERVVLSESVIRVTLRSENDAVGAPPAVIEIEQNQTKSNHSCSLPADTQRKPDQKLLQAVVRAHAWLADLQSRRFSTIEELATAAKIHPKVARQGLRLAFLAPK